MAINGAKNLVNGAIVPTTAAALYTVGTGLNRVSVGLATVTNYSGSPATATLQVLQNGETAADNYKRVVALALAAGETKVLAELAGQSINAGGKIWGEASAATSISFSASGTEYTS